MDGRAGVGNLTHPMHGAPRRADAGHGGRHRSLSSCRRLALAACLVSLSLLQQAGVALAGEPFWQASGRTQIAALQSESVVPLTPQAQQMAALAGRRISRIDVNGRWQGNAWVEARLCLQGARQCVPLQAGRLNTAAFQGQAAATPFEVRYKVLRWAGATQPLFIDTDLVVWHQDR